MLLRRSLAVMVALSTVPVSVAVADHIEGTECGSTASCAGHQHWPRMTPDDVQLARQGGQTLTGKPGNTDELLGAHGSDKLYGEDLSDVLWGDRIGKGQPTSQRDEIYGGPGEDFIYSSHGRNKIEGGEDNDAIKTRYGRGTVDCGPGRDIVYVPKSRRSNWTFKGCERFDGRSQAARGEGIKPLD